MSAPVNIIMFLLLGGLLGLAVGIAFTAVFMLARVGERDKPEQTEPGAPLEQPILKVWGAEDGGQLWIELGAKRYMQARNLDSVQRARLEELLQHLLDWMGIRASAGVPASAAAGLEGSPAGIEAASHLQGGEVYLVDQDLAEKPKVKPLDALARSLRGEVRASQTAPTSIVAQVDEILQEMLAEAGLVGRGIRLAERPDRGMVVYVGLVAYQAIDEVPDEQIRKLIRAAVARWEERPAGD